MMQAQYLPAVYTKHKQYLTNEATSNISVRFF